VYVTSLHSHSLQVPDLALALDFYQDFGLVDTSTGEVASVACEGRDQEQILLREGAEKRLQAATFTVVPGSLDELAARLAAAGHPAVEGLPAREAGLWVRDPDGLLLQFIEAEPAGWREYPARPRNFDGRAERIDDARWLEVAVPLPRRLGHVIKFTPDMAATEHFYLEVVGLKLSDRVDGVLSFWNHGLGGDHHLFGAIASSHPGLHHASFEVADFDEIGMGAQRMAEKGHHIQWGLGRHTFGSNLFNYIQDPWGSWVEYFADMDVITSDWEGRTWEAPPAIWGPPLPPPFMANTEATGSAVSAS
jgi:catechol-2,3-dioxygenase